MHSLYPVAVMCIKVCILESKMRKVVIVQNLMRNPSSLGFRQEHKKILVPIGKCMVFEYFMMRLC